jgi:diguanylate cyclase (GGDEF)-like protein/PAS domain S-box-containing protein
MEKNLGVHDLVMTIESSETEASAERLSDLFDGISRPFGKPLQNSSSDEPAAEARPGDSIFSQLLERIVQGYSISLESEAEESTSLEILLDGVSDAVLILTPTGSIADANQAFYRTFGYSKAELMGSSIFELLPEGYRAAFHEKLASFSVSGDEPRKASPEDILAFRGLRHDGVVLSMDCLLSAIRLGDKPAVLALIRNLSFDRDLYEQLKESKDHYVALSETITEAIFRLDDGFHIIFANSGIKNTFGFEREEVIGEHFSILFPPEVYAKHESDFRKYFFVDDEDRLEHGLKRTLEFLARTKHRGVAPMEMSFGNSRDYKGRTLTCVIRDITQRKTLERRLRHLAYHDKLTGLGNRDLFNEDMATMIQASQDDPSRKGAVLYLDLDGFKHINDTFGHDAGDKLLIETARRIRVCLRDHDSAYRFGGDEFVVILAGIRKADDALLVAERILAGVANPYILRSEGLKTGSRIGVGVSIGIAIVPDNGKTLEEATKSADIAMYCSKESGKNKYTLYDPDISSKSTERWKLEQEMKEALSSGRFSLVYQPIVSAGGAMKGMEALVRWHRVELADVPPSTFVPIAEENGLIVALGDLVLRRACYDAKKLRERGYTGLYISVNVSSRQFELPDFPERLEQIVRSSGVPPSTLKIELTESVIMRNTADAIERIKDIKQRLPGISFMIDDFGTGYSSLSYLSRLPVDALKIDISFVMNLAERQNEKVVNAIINLGHSLELDIVAEGIETKEQLSYFAERDCGSMQGFYFLRPAPIGEICKLMDRSRAARVAKTAVKEPRARR